MSAILSIKQMVFCPRYSMANVEFCRHCPDFVKLDKKKNAIECKFSGGMNEKEQGFARQYDGLFGQGGWDIYKCTICGRPFVRVGTQAEDEAVICDSVSCAMKSLGINLAEG